jgi:retron-type reverse transcriptase
MKRLYISLEMIADYNNLLVATYKAARGKRSRSNVHHFLENTNDELTKLGEDIRQEKLPYGRFQTFEIFDPKQREIHAACFQDRVFHHALMNIAGEKLETAMFFHSYACRKNKGVHKAVQQVQKNLQRFQWWVKIDIASYFATIDHQRLLQLLQRCFKGKEIHQQFARVLVHCPKHQTHGLPIGSLTSQYFANYYLDGLDRKLANHQQVKANVRYMDDVIWWCLSKQKARQTLSEIKEYLQLERGLQVKKSTQILPSSSGVSYCGFRITQGNIRMSRRRKRNFTKRRLYWENEYRYGRITANQLQTAYAAVHAIGQGTNNLLWRQKQLINKPSILL